MKNDYSITDIETAVSDAVYGLGVSRNVFTNRPRSSDRDLSDFVVCKVAGRVRDRGALGEATIAIYIYVRDVQNMKNGKRLSVMTDTIKKGLPYEIGRLVFKPYSLSEREDEQDKFGYHVRTITIDMFIKKNQ